MSNEKWYLSYVAILLFLLPTQVFAQGVSAIKFSDMSFAADIKIYFTDMSFSADEKWYIAGECSSISATKIYVTDMSFAADLKIYLTDTSFSADRKICITNPDDAPDKFWEAYKQ